jgi:serine/threonine protein phosphatase PrpC
MSPLEELRVAVEEANRAVNEQAAVDPALTGMGTTCTALVVRDQEAFVAHVGDSRAYLVRNGRIHQLTRDHSVVAQLVDQKQLSPELASVDPRRNVVTRSVGVKAQVEVDAERIGELIQPGDTFLLCSDGLHGQVNDEELARLASGPDLERACRDLIALANGRGGPDNITVLLTRMGDGGSDPLRGGFEVADQLNRGAGKGAAVDDLKPSSKAWTATWLVVAMLGLLLVLAAVAWLVRRLNTEAGVLGLSP